MATWPNIRARINTWVDNDPVKSYQKYRLNSILNDMATQGENAVAGTQDWGNIGGNLNEQTDVVNYIDVKSMAVRNSVPDLTGTGLELLVDNAIYNDGTVVFTQGSGGTSDAVTEESTF